MDLPTMRTKVRRDLHDEDASNYRWTDDEIDRHIQHAILDISQAVPLQSEDKTLVIPTPASKDIDISSLIGLMIVDAVEYPVDSDPREYRRFAVWGTTLTLLIDDTVTAGEAVTVKYSAVHTITDSACSLPPHLEDLCAVGAGAYAGIEWASYAINQLNVGGEPTSTEYLKWAQDRMEFYQKELKRYGRQSRLKIARLYAE
jgi:hypothetical protein